MKQRVRLWKAKLKAARVMQKDWTKVHNRATRALARVGKHIDELERKIETELAKP